MLIGMNVSAQTIMSPIDASTVPANGDYINGVWYTDEYGGSFVWNDTKELGEKFLKEMAKELEIDLNHPFSTINGSKYYRSVYCESFQVKWVKLPYNEKMLLIRVYI